MAALRFGLMDMNGLAIPGGPLELAEKAEAWGYDGFWIPDLWSYTVPDPFVVLAAAATRTRHIRLGTNVSPLPFRSPFQFAKLAASVDVLSGGRLDLGVGIGVVPREFELEQVDKRKRGAISNENLEIVRGLLHETHVSHQGARYAFEDFTLEPRPVQQPLPIYVGAVGRVIDAVARRVARLGDGFIPGRAAPDLYEAYRARILECADEIGRDMSGFRWSISAWTCLATTSERAHASLRAALGEESGSDAKAGHDSGIPLTPESFLAGTPRDCIETIERYQGVGLTDMCVSFGCPAEERLEQYEQFAKEVIPHFRG